MATEQSEGVFHNPLILYSEHKRVLGDAIKRGDEKITDAERRGFHKGVAMTAWGAMIVALMACLAGFNAGLSFVQ